jgi:hypothetical protein
MTLFLLRAYGDFVIAVNMVSRSLFREKIMLVASKHLEPLYQVIEPLLSNPVQIRFVDFKLDKQLMRCFTNKYLLHPHTLTELSALRRYLHDEKITGTAYLEQQKRIFLPRFFCQHPFRSIVSNDPVYQSYADFLSVPLETLEAIKFDKNKKSRSVLIVPDSRQKVKVIDASIIKKIQDHYTSTHATVTVAFFRKAWDGVAGNSIVYHNFNELIQLIQETDLLIGGDSLPVHLAQLLGTPHLILYPGSKTQHFFTPFALKHRSFFAFEAIRTNSFSLADA